MTDNNTPLVSVIVPVYNVAPYVERCAKSLFEQTLKDIEIIFVDDCSPDNSIELVKNLANNYPDRLAQIKYVRHEHNRGLAQARKTGLDVAQVSMWLIAIRMIMFPWRCMRNYMMKRRVQSRRLCIVIFSWIMVFKKQFVAL